MQTETKEQTIAATGNAVASTTDVANATFTKDKSYNAVIKGFTYIKDYAFLTIFFGGHNHNVIIGAKHDNKISDLVQLKGMSVEFTYLGEREVNGKSWPNLRMNCLSF
jgi:hypothetical protein